MKIFIDSSAWLALDDKRDKHHERAVSISKRLKEEKVELVTSEYVFSESLTIIRYAVNHEAAVLFGRKILESRIIEFAEVDEAIRYKAWEIFKKYRDKKLSFTDCSSFAIMEKMDIKKAFAFNEHFDQVGFESL